MGFYMHWRPTNICISYLGKYYTICKRFNLYKINKIVSFILPSLDIFVILR